MLSPFLLNTVLEILASAIKYRVQKRGKKTVLICGWPDCLHRKFLGIYKERKKNPIIDMWVQGDPKITNIQNPLYFYIVPMSTQTQNLKCIIIYKN